MRSVKEKLKINIGGSLLTRNGVVNHNMVNQRAKLTPAQGKTALKIFHCKWLTTRCINKEVGPVHRYHQRRAYAFTACSFDIAQPDISQQVAT